MQRLDRLERAVAGVEYGCNTTGLILTKDAHRQNATTIVQYSLRAIGEALVRQANGDDVVQKPASLPEPARFIPLETTNYASESAKIVDEYAKLVAAYTKSTNMPVN